jgi:anti-sigma factor RsiW
MTPEELNEQLADYLGGELDAERTAEFERSLNDNPDLAEEVQSLRRARDAFNGLKAPSVAPPASATPRAAHASTARTLGIMRFAAAILIAFTLGVVARDVTVTPTTSDTPTVVRRESSVQQELGMAYARQSGKSGLARSLLAVAHATR